MRNFLWKRMENEVVVQGEKRDGIFKMGLTRTSSWTYIRESFDARKKINYYRINDFDKVKENWSRTQQRYWPLVKDTSHIKKKKGKRKKWIPSIIR